MHLAESQLGKPLLIEKVEGDVAFRRRLLELGLLPGTQITLVGVAPLGDPLELRVRGSSLSIRRAEAQLVAVRPRPEPAARPIRASCQGCSGAMSEPPLVGSTP